MKTLGWALLGVGIGFLLRAAQLDRRLQRFRAPGVPAAAYRGTIGRWQRDRYTAEGQALLAATRRAYALFCIASFVGGVLLEAAAA